MLRGIILLLSVLTLSGCAGQAQPERKAANAPCASVADQRARDAADNGYGADLQSRIAKQVYADCMKSAGLALRSGN